MSSSDGGGIPSGLNRIRTRSAAAAAGDDPSASGCDEPSPASSRGAPTVRKGRKIARWLGSYLSPKSSDKHTYSISSSPEEWKPEIRKHGNNSSLSRMKHIWKFVKGRQPVSKSNFIEHASCPPKSFSHELVLQPGSPPCFQPHTRSFSDLQEFFVSLDSKFNDAKEKINTELVAYASDINRVFQNGYLLEADRTAMDLLRLSQECTKMSASEFRENCERIVKDVAERRQQCHSIILEKLITRMLFILTRCTRLLQFQKISGQMNQNSFERLKKCLDDVPAIDMEWDMEHAEAKSDVDKIMGNRSFSRNSEDELNIESCTSTTEKSMDGDAKIIYSPSNEHFVLNSNDALLPSTFSNQSFPKHTLNNPSQNLVQEQGEFPKELDLVICRICEENIPANHLESHSYLCAYAEECDSEGFDIDERLHRIADILEYIVESYNRSFNTLCCSPENPKLPSMDSVVMSEVQSPKLQEWHNKGIDGMFEDLHEMDTSRIDDSHIAASNIFKSLLAMKLGACNTANPCGSITPASSTNTPRSGHFDLFWLEHNNPSEHEDVDQMIKLVDLAHKAANIGFEDEGACVSLVKCLQDLLVTLQKNETKALVMDTFGLRVKKLLKEKYLLFSEVIEKRGKNINQNKETTGSSILQCSRKDRTSIDDFHIIKQISRGAFGKVFLARKRTTGDLFAIKVLKKMDMIRKNDIERILAERDILISVRNPFVVRFFYSFTCRDNLYLVMEYLNGGDLYSLLRKIGCLEEKTARIYVAELVLALEYLHSLGIVHRDLKPDNILIASDGHIKLTDFGLSKIGLIDSAIKLARSKITTVAEAQNPHISSLPQAVRKRKRPSAVGTPDYLAPEILLGSAHGYAADWWSVGIILFELIKGIPPFTGRSPEIIFDNILNRRIPWPDVPEDMSFVTKDFIDRLLTQDQELRLGASGASEVKKHPFFKEVDWDNLAIHKAAFVPCPESEDDTSYFMSRYKRSSSWTPKEEGSSNRAYVTSSSSNSGLPASEEQNEEVDADCIIPVDLCINFSFKNLSQLASMNHDVLLQSGKTSTCSSPSDIRRS